MKPSGTVSMWDTLHPDALRILQDAEEAVRKINRHETFHGWLAIARGVTVQRETAMTIAGTDDVNAHAYRVAWRDGVTRYPELGKINKTERAHCVWLWDNHDRVEDWHRTLPSPQARKFNHPSTIWRKNPLGEERGGRGRGGRPAKIAEALTVTADRLDAVTDRIESKIGGAELFDMSPELIGESANNFIEVFGAEDTRRFIAELQALLAPPRTAEPPLDPAFTASVKKPRARRKRQTEPRAERDWDAPPAQPEKAVKPVVPPWCKPGRLTARVELLRQALETAGAAGLHKWDDIIKPRELSEAAYDVIGGVGDAARRLGAHPGAVFLARRTLERLLDGSAEMAPVVEVGGRVYLRRFAPAAQIDATVEAHNILRTELR